MLRDAQSVARREGDEAAGKGTAVERMDDYV